MLIFKIIYYVYKRIIFLFIIIMLINFKILKIIFTNNKKCGNNFFLIEIISALSS